MIEVNLLPLEYRKVDKTPLPVFLTLIAAVIVVTGSIFGYLFFHIAVVPKAKSKYETNKKLDKEVKDLNQEIANLRKQSESYQDRLDMIMEVRKSRILWSKKLTLLCQLRHDKIWFENITMEQMDVFKKRKELATKKKTKKRAKKKKKPAAAKKVEFGGSLTISCRQKTQALLPKLKFMDRLETHRLFSPHFSKLEDLDEDVRIVEDEAVDEDRLTRAYDIKLMIKPPKFLAEED